METSGISIPIGQYALPGMATSTLVGIVMNLVLPMPPADKPSEPAEDNAGAAKPKD
jgi:uracil permease